MVPLSRRLLRWFFRSVLFGISFLCGFALPYGWQLDLRLSQRMALVEPASPSQMFARPLVLEEAGPVSVAQLELELNAAGYSPGRGIGTYQNVGRQFRVTDRRGSSAHFDIIDAAVVNLRGERGTALAAFVVDPARLGRRYAAGSQARQTLSLEQLPPLLIAGVQAVEDRRFARHHGLDLTGIARAAVTNLKAGQIVQGGSTLTQQLVKSLFFNNQRRWVRKAQEAALALVMEWRYDKAVILHGYLNEVFLGQQGNVAIHGFPMAAEHYFGRPIDQLEAQHIALLIGLLKGPSYYNPWRHVERAQLRRNLVLKMFYETGLLSRSQLDTALRQPLGVLSKPVLAQPAKPAFLDLVQLQLARALSGGPDEDSRGGREVATTLSMFHQAMAERALSEGLVEVERQRSLPTKSLQGALVLIDRRNGEILAAAGGRNSQVDGFNRVLNARRPVGSIIKPFIYRSALRDGLSLAYPVRDEPITVDLPNGDRWSPANFDRQSHGTVTLVEALTRSYNQAAARLGMELGVERVLNEVRQLGWQGAAQPHPSLLLGAIEMTPLEVAQLYLSLTGDGGPQAVNAVREVRENGAVQYRARQPKIEAPGPVNYLLTFALQRAVVEGTGRSLASFTGTEGIAGKTGTSNDLRDGWFVGFSQDLLAVVWVGRDDNQPAGITGASGALPVFGRLFAAIPWRPLKLSTPGSIDYQWVEATTGKLADSRCPGIDFLPFVAGTEPVEIAPCADQIDAAGRKNRWWRIW